MKQNSIFKKLIVFFFTGKSDKEILKWLDSFIETRGLKVVIGSKLFIQGSLILIIFLPENRLTIYSITLIIFLIITNQIVYFMSIYHFNYSSKLKMYNSMHRINNIQFQSHLVFYSLNPHILGNLKMVLTDIAISSESKIQISEKLHFLNELYHPYFEKLNLIARKNLISIHEEIDLIEHYSKLLKYIRTFQLIVNCPKSISLEVPPIILQPIIENSIQWAFIEPKNPENKIVINVVDKELFFQVTISDNGIGIPQENKFGTGINSIIKRLGFALKMHPEINSEFNIYTNPNRYSEFLSGTTVIYKFHKTWKEKFQ